MISSFNRSLFACSVVVLLSTAGCKSAAPPATATANPAEKPSAFASMTDEQLVHAQMADGLGLGLKVTGKTFKVDEPISFEVLTADFGAREPIASGMCTGFSLTYDEVTTHDSRTGELNNPRCFTAIPMPDEIPFTRGKIKSAVVTQRTASNMQIPPGTYQMTVTWKAVQAGKGTLFQRPVYTTLTSNPVSITVTQ